MTADYKSFLFSYITVKEVHHSSAILLYSLQQVGVEHLFWANASLTPAVMATARFTIYIHKSYCELMILA